MDYLSIGPVPEFYWFYCMLIVGGFIGLQLFDLKETFLYLTNDPRIYTHMQWEKYAVTGFVMIGARLALHVLVLVVYGIFYTPTNLRYGWLLFMFILICCKNVLEFVHQLYFLNLGLDNKTYFVDLTTLMVTDANGAEQKKMTSATKTFTRVVYWANYAFIAAFVIGCTAFACVRTFELDPDLTPKEELETPQILLILSCIFICLGLIFNVSVNTRPTNYESRIKEFLETPGNVTLKKKISEVRKPTRQSVLIPVSGVFRNGYIEDKSELHELLTTLGVNPDTHVVRIFGDSFYVLDNHKAMVLDNLFSEKKSGVHIPRIGGFLYPAVGHMLPYPHIDYDNQGNHRVQNLPLIGVLNPDMIGYHVIFFRIMGFGVGLSSSLDTPTTFVWYFTAFMLQFYLIFFNNIAQAVTIVGVTLFSPLYLSLMGQKGEYVTQAFYWTYFGWGLMILASYVVGDSNAYVTKRAILNSQLVLQSVNANTSYNDVPEYIAASWLSVILCFIFMMWQFVRIFQVGNVCCKKTKDSMSSQDANAQVYPRTEKGVAAPLREDSRLIRRRLVPLNP